MAENRLWLGFEVGTAIAVPAPKAGSRVAVFGSVGLARVSVLCEARTIDDLGDTLHIFALPVSLFLGSSETRPCRPYRPWQLYHEAPVQTDLRRSEFRLFVPMFVDSADDGRIHGSYVSDGLPWINRRTTFLGIVIPLTTLAWICLGLRIYTRIFRLRCFGWDDVVLLFAQLSGTTTAISLSLMFDYGLGQRAADVVADDKVMFTMLFWIANATFNMCNALVKLSMLAQYLRVFQVPVMRTTCKVLVGVFGVWGLAFTFISWFPCFPPSVWYVDPSSSHCYGYASSDPLQVYQTIVLATATNMTFDIIIWALPIHLLSNKSVERKTKQSLSCLLFLGSIILSLAAGRCVAAGYTAGSKSDEFYQIPIVVVLGETENRLSCILATIPVFWPVVEAAAERIHGLYRIVITHEFYVGSTRVLPGETRTEIGAYEAPHWADSAAGQFFHGIVEDSRKCGFPGASDMHLPQWPSLSNQRSRRSSSSERVSIASRSIGPAV